MTEPKKKIKVPVIELDAEVKENVAYFNHAIAHPVPGTKLVELLFVSGSNKGEVTPAMLIPVELARSLEKQIHKSIKKINGEKVEQETTEVEETVEIRGIDGTKTDVPTGEAS